MNDKSYSRIIKGSICYAKQDGIYPASSHCKDFKSEKKMIKF